MKKKLAVALLVLVGLVAVLLLVIAMQPSDYQVERSTSIAAPPADVFVQVNDLRKWDAWSPWAKLDPDAKTTYEGPEAGEGSVFRWSGNQDVGEGSMTIVESMPPEKIGIRLDFVRPFEDTADVGFRFEPKDDNTLVTWSMSGKNNFIGKAMCLFMDMEEMIGGQYEQGLANLKEVVESKAKLPESDEKPAADDTEEQA